MVRGFVVALLVLSTVSSASAGWTLMTFDDGDLEKGDGGRKIGQYISELYPGDVTVTGARVHKGDGFGQDLYLWTRDAGRIVIELGVPTTQVAFRAHIFTANEGPDFTFIAFDENGDRILRKRWNPDVDDVSSRFNSGLLDRPAYRLVFSGGDTHDIGFDNLRLVAVPAPGAIALGGIGLALVGILRRKAM